MFLQLKVVEGRSQKHRRNFNYKLWPLASTKSIQLLLDYKYNIFVAFFPNALLLRTDNNHQIYQDFKLFLMLTSISRMIWKSTTLAKCGMVDAFHHISFLRFFFICLCKFQNLNENTF